MKILVFSDIHGDEAALTRLMAQEADMYFSAGDLANWGRGLEKLGPIMQPKADRTYVIPGNHESAEDTARFCEQFGLHNAHGKAMEAGGYTIASLGYSNPTPFNTPGEYSEQELADRLAPFAGRSPLVLICHAPPKDTKLDDGGGRHFGSSAVRDFLEKNQPLYFFCGHIHESAGVEDRIGKTHGVNVGKRGYLLDLAPKPSGSVQEG